MAFIRDLWRCKTCGAMFDHCPTGEYVLQCTKCVEVEVLRAALAEKERESRYHEALYLEAIKEVSALRNLCGEQLLRIHQLIGLVERDRIAAEKAGAPVPNHYRQWLHELYEQKDRLKAAAEGEK
jgi:hypothetical protein